MVRTTLPTAFVIETETLWAHRVLIFDAQMHAPEAEVEKELADEGLEAVGGPDWQKGRKRR